VRDRVNVGIAQWLPVAGEPEANLETALELIDGLALRGCDLVVLPELWPCGFDWNRLGDDARAAAEPLDGPRVKALGEAALAAGAWLCAGSVPEANGDRAPFNTLVLFDPAGELRATHRKTHLYAPLGEDRAVTAGSATSVVDTEEFGPLGLSICFDGDFPEVARAMRLRGARIVIHPSAYERAAERWWDVLYPANALANGQWWIMANQCGTNSSGTLLGGSQIISPMGHVVARAVRAGGGESPDPELLRAELDLGREIERADRGNAALWGERRPELYGSR